MSLCGAGAMYIYPRIRLPAKAVAEAQSRGLAPDLFYSMELLDATGVVVVPVRGMIVSACAMFTVLSWSACVCVSMWCMCELMTWY